MDQNFKQKIIKNVLFTFATRVWVLAISIWLIPYMLSRLGNDEYGVWVLIAAFVGYIALLDFGFGTSFVKYIAEFNARGDQRSVNGVLSTALIFYIVATCVIIIVAYPSIGVILNFFNIPQGMEEKTRFVLELGVIAFLWGNFNRVYEAVINGLQRMDISGGTIAFLSVCNAVGCIIVLELGYGIRGLAVNLLITQVIGTVVTVYFAYRIYPGLRFELKSVGINFLTLFRYGVNLQVSSIAGLINFQFDKLLVNRFIDASHVTFYDIGSRPAITLRTFPVLFLSVLTPASSELEVRKGKEELYELFTRASKYIAIIVFLLFTGAMVTGQPIIEAWVGHGYDGSVVVLRILCIGYLLNTAIGPVSPLVQGMGRPDYQRNAEVLSLILNVALSVILIRRYGFYGAPIGTTIAMSVASVYYVWSFHRFMGRPLIPFLKSTFLKPALSAVISGVLGLTVTLALMRYASAGRFGALVVFLVAGCIFSVSYLGLILKWRYLDDWDMALLRDHLPMVHVFDRIIPKLRQGRP